MKKENKRANKRTVSFVHRFSEKRNRPVFFLSNVSTLSQTIFAYFSPVRSIRISLLLVMNAAISSAERGACWILARS